MQASSALPTPVLIAAYVIFLLSYLVFALGKFPGMKVDRTGAAIIGAVLMLAFGVVRPAEALSFVDFSTIVLLFSMMLMVAYLRLAGFFDWIAEIVARHLQPRQFLPAVILLSGVLSAFFVNDIVCLIMAPFTLTATRRMGLRPIPYLLAVATASNIGSVATITGNPQNILIGSLSGIRYVKFIEHLGPVAILGLLVDWLVISLVARRTAPLGNGKQIDEGARPIALHARAHPTGDSQSQAGGKQVDRRELIKPGIVTALVFAGFLAGFPPALVAALGAAAMLVTRTHDPREVYDNVDWSLLVFFVGLFLIVGGAEKTGLMEKVLLWGHGWNLQNAGVFTVVTAALSNVVSNVPAVMLLKSLVPHFPNPQSGWLSLAMASTLAGNLTITGSVANIIVIEQTKSEADIGFWQYARVGVPVTLLTLAIGWLWLAVIRF